MAIQPTTPVASQFAPAQATPGGKAGGSTAAQDTLPVGSSASSQETKDATQAATRQNPPDPEVVRKAIERAQQALPPRAREIAFSMNEQADTVVVKIIDRESEEVIRQIPSEEFLKIAEALNEQVEHLRAGLLVEQKA
jgi:flagellar protein FlaG